ncbi:MAG: amidohydrolase family protein [Acidobacteriia bacterium]|nr:amidohydrolase family protein [Terriglobia bacterium]
MRLRPIFLALSAAIALAQPPSGSIVIQTSTLLDGRGGVLKNQQIVIQGSRIQSVSARKEKATDDLRGLTVMPGWIDTHVHLNRHMDANHKSVSGGDKPEDAALYTAGDAWLTLEDGFTTVQRVGAAIDAVVRDRINQECCRGRAF